MKKIFVYIDGRIFPAKAKEENIVAQGDNRFGLNDTLALGLGIANLGNRDKTGAEFSVAVLSQDLDFLRIHFGGTSQYDNKGFFGGLDKTITLFDCDFTLRSDIIQINNENDTITRVGFIYDLDQNFLVESRGSFPAESGTRQLLEHKAKRCN